mgnify:CR=1 FL=1
MKTKFKIVWRIFAKIVLAALLLTGFGFCLSVQSVGINADDPATVFGGAACENKMSVETINMWISESTLYINTPELNSQPALLEVFDSSGNRLMAKPMVLNELTTKYLNFEGFVIVKLTTVQKVLTTKGILAN